MRHHHFVLGVSQFKFEQWTARVFSRSQLPWERTKTELRLKLRGDNELVVRRATRDHHVQGCTFVTYSFVGYERVPDSLLETLKLSRAREVLLWEFLKGEA